MLSNSSCKRNHLRTMLNTIHLTVSFNSIKVLDENDSPPILQYPKNLISISEYHDMGEPVAQVKATDADDPMTLNGQVEFNVAGGTGKGNNIHYLTNIE